MNRSVLGKSKMTFTVFYKIILRVLSIAAIIVLLYGAVTNIICLKESIENRHDFFMNIFFIIANIITAAFFIFLFFKPEKLVPCSMVSIIYAIPNLIDNGSIGIGYFMLILFYLSLYIQGFFKKRKIFKICAFIICFIAMMLTNLRFGFEVFISSFCHVIGYTLLFSVIILMFVKFILEEKRSIMGQKILDLRKPVSEGLIKDRDVKWLKQILNGDKYSAIASESAVSDGTIRNRIREVFKIIGVTDKKQFTSIYSDALVISTQEEFQAWKDTLV